MASLLSVYKKKLAELDSQITANSLPLDSIAIFQELKYRVEVLETLRMFAATAPITLEGKVMAYHFCFVNVYINFLLDERKAGTKTDENGKKKRETAKKILNDVVEAGRKKFSCYKPNSSDSYKKSIDELFSTVIPVWIQYRDLFIKI